MRIPHQCWNPKNFFGIIVFPNNYSRLLSTVSQDFHGFPFPGFPVEFLDFHDFLMDFQVFQQQTILLFPSHKKSVGAREHKTLTLFCNDDHELPVF